MSVRSATLPSSALHRDCPVFIRLQHGQHRVGASQVSSLHKLVMASCFCHLQKLFTCPEVEECTWAAHGPHTCSRASELPWEATVRKAKNKCQAKVTEQHRQAGAPGEAEVGLEGVGAPWSGFSGEGHRPGWSWLPASVPDPLLTPTPSCWGNGATAVPILQRRGLRPLEIRVSETTNKTAVRATSAPFPQSQSGRVSCTPICVCACVWHGHLCMICVCAW